MSEEYERERESERERERERESDREMPLFPSFSADKVCMVCQKSTRENVLVDI